MEDSIKKQNLSVDSTMDNVDENSANESRGKFALSVLMDDDFCKNFNVYELSRLAQVDKLCHKEVQREYDRRQYFDLRALPYPFSKELMDPSYHVSKNLNIIPYITVLFPGINYLVDDVRHEEDVNLEKDVFKLYQKQFPNVIAVIGVCETFLNKNLMHSIPVIDSGGIILDRYNPAGVLSLSLPNNRRLRVKYSCIFESDFEDSEEQYERMAGELTPDIQDTTSTIIAITTSAGHVAFLNAFASKFRDKKFTFWGFGSGYRMYSKNDNNLNVDGVEGNRLVCFALNLFGPSLNSWSIVINAYITIEGLKTKLQDFKNKIIFKKYSLGLIAGPVILEENNSSLYYKQSQEKMNIMKAIFPEIPFLGTFSKPGHSYFGLTPDPDGGADFVMLSNKIITIMIFTYD